MAYTITMVLLGLLFFGSLITGGALFANSFFVKYNPAAIRDVGMLNNTQKITEISQTTQTKLTSQGANVFIAADVILTGGWSALLSIITSTVTIPIAVGDVVNNAGTQTGIQIPVWFIGLILSGLAVFIGYRVLGIATRTETGGI